MDPRKRARLKIALSNSYAAHREKTPPEVIEAVVSAMLVEDERARRIDRCRIGAVRFACGQVRYIPAWTWAAQLAIVALMVALSQFAGDTIAARWSIGIMSTASVLVCVPTLSASRAHGMDEIERSCPNNASSVLVARMIILGCSCALCVGLLVAAACRGTHIGALSIALWACPPFFTCAAGSLLIMRRLHPSLAPVSCTALTTSCCSILLIVANMWPSIYDQASIGMWALASVAAAAWTVVEAAMLARQTAAGLDALPQRSAHGAF